MMVVDEVVKPIPKGWVQHRAVDMAAGKIQGEIVEVIRLVSQELSERIVKMVKVIPPERLQQRTVEQTVGKPSAVQHKAPMVREADKYRDADEANKAKVKAKNRLENNSVTVWNTFGDEKLVDKFEAGDEEKAVQDAMDGSRICWQRRVSLKPETRRSLFRILRTGWTRIAWHTKVSWKPNQRIWKETVRKCLCKTPGGTFDVTQPPCPPW